MLVLSFAVAAAAASAGVAVDAAVAAVRVPVPGFVAAMGAVVVAVMMVVAYTDKECTE